MKNHPFKLKSHELIVYDQFEWFDGGERCLVRRERTNSGTPSWELMDEDECKFIVIEPIGFVNELEQLYHEWIKTKYENISS